MAGVQNETVASQNRPHARQIVLLNFFNDVCATTGEENMTDSEIVETLATKVMGCVGIVKRLSPEHWALVGDKTNPPFAVFDNAGGQIWLVPSNGGSAFDPLTSISDAFQGVKRMIELGWEFTLFTIGDKFNAAFTKREQWATPKQSDLSENSDLCRAICDALVAAIAAIGEQK